MSLSRPSRETRPQGESRSRIARLENDPAVSVLTITDPGLIEWQRGGAAPEIGEVVFEFLDGGSWVPVASAGRVAGGWQATGLWLPSSAVLRASGRALGGKSNGSSWLVRETISYADGVFPRIEVQAEDDILVSGQEVDLGTVNWKETSAPTTFTLTNTGDVSLVGLSLSLDGAHAFDFQTSPLSATTLAPGESTSFQVTFTTSVVRFARQAELRIASNHEAGSAFRIGLIGKAIQSETAFNPGANGFVNAIALQTDGKILIGGNFTNLGGQSRSRIARLNPDGTLDADFNPTAGAAVNSIAVQNDGKILIGGSFENIGGYPRSRIARLHPDGTLDAVFNPGAGGAVSSIAIQADGKILLGGGFGTVGGQTRTRIARLNADGTLDESFDPAPSSNVNTIAIQADGKILVGGFFSTIGGLSRPNIARLNPDGTGDAAFNPGAASTVYTIALQTDGKILLGGSFSSIGGQSRSRIARLNADGTLDAGFIPTTGNVVETIALQADGKILIGGSFSSVSGQLRSRIARINPDGSLDASFDPVAGDSLSVSVKAIALQADGKVLAGGDFTSIGGQSRSRIARLLNDPATSELSVTGTGQVDWQRGGSAPELAQVTFEVLDGASWVPAGSAERVAGGWQASGVSLPARTWLRARGRASGGFYNGSQGMFEETITYGGTEFPQMEVSGGRRRPDFRASHGGIRLGTLEGNRDHPQLYDHQLGHRGLGGNFTLAGRPAPACLRGKRPVGDRFGTR